MAGAVQRLYGDGFRQNIAHTQSLNNRLAVVSAILPVAVGIDGQSAVIAVVAGTGKLILSGVGIADGQGTGDDQRAGIIFTGRTDIGSADHGTVVGAIDGDGQVVIGAIHRLDGDGIHQRLAIAQRLNGRLTAAGRVTPGTRRIQSDGTVQAAVIARR